MKITAQEEYGLRILIRIAGCKDADGMSIPQLSEAEGLSSHYVAKLTRILRMEGFINSTPGYKGGYVLAKPAQEIIINKVLKALAAALFDKEFCGSHSGITETMYQFGRLFRPFALANDPVHSRSVTGKVTLHDLVNSEKESEKILKQILQQNSTELSEKLNFSK